MPALYSLSAVPTRAVLGETINIVLHSAASGDSTGTLAFDHPSLILELSQLASSEEPRYAFPNRTAVQEGELLIRLQSIGTVEDLKSGEERKRAFKLHDLYGAQALDLGEFDLSYRFEDAQPDIRVTPVRMRISSDPNAVPLLLSLLDHENFGIRARAAGLLHRMTAHGLDYDPRAAADVRDAAMARWTAWWQSEGSRLPWNYDSDGVAFGPAAPSPRGARLGSVLYGQTALTPVETGRFLGALDAWLRQPVPSSLRGSQWVADREISYPPEPALIRCDAEMERTLAAVVGQLAALGNATPDHAAEAGVVLQTIARMPCEGLVPALRELETTVVDSPSWTAARSTVTGLLDLTDRERVPVNEPVPAAALS